MIDFDYVLDNISVIDKAILIATTMHKGQIDKSGKPFIMHPIRVAAYMGADAEDAVIAAAILHDVVEDTECELEELYDIFKFPSITVTLVEIMTRRKYETYKEYIYRIGRSHPMAIRLKLADLRDNMDPVRAITPELRGMIEKRYVWSEEFLKSKLQENYERGVS